MDAVYDVPMPTKLPPPPYTDLMSFPEPGDRDDHCTIWGPDGALQGPDDLCWADAPGISLCTRLKGHDGPHAFGNGKTITKTWWSE